MKLLMIFTGGTIACRRSDSGLSPDAENSFALLEPFAEHEFECATPYFTLSENLGFDMLRRLYDCLSEHDLERYDGVIVAHGTDTLAYTAAYLSLRLGLCDTPVVLVSAAYPLSDSRTNGFDNMRGAIDFIASRQGKGVFVSYKNDGEPVRIHRGTMVLPHAPYDDSVRSAGGMLYATVIGGVVEKNPDYCETNTGASGVCGEERRVAWLRAHPGMLLPQLDTIDAVLLEGYHSGTLPTADARFAAFCMEAKRKGCPVFLTGAREGFDYESKQAFERLGIQPLPPVSPACAYVGCVLGIFSRADSAI